jgi:hypothetical protein
MWTRASDDSRLKICGHSNQDVDVGRETVGFIDWGTMDDPHGGVASSGKRLAKLW